MSNDVSPGPRLLHLWSQLRRVPLGTRIFSWIAGRMVPYTGAMRSQVVKLRPGYAEVRLKDRRSVRNHLRSSHAVALVNLGEFTSGLAFVTTIPPGYRAIVVQLRAAYLKKARGTLTARSTFEQSTIEFDGELDTKAVIWDEQDDVVAEITATWKVRATNPS